MSNSGMGFGGFLLGLGAGWYLFQFIDFSNNLFSYLLILMGVSIIIDAFLSQGKRNSPLRGVFGGLFGGIFFAIILTQGFGLVYQITDEFDQIQTGDFKVTETFNLNAPIEANMVSLEVMNVNGGVDIAHWSGDSVKIDLVVQAKGDTTAEAEDNLDQFDHDLQNYLIGDKQEISLSFPMSSLSLWSLYSVTISVYFPEDVSAEVLIDTTNGEIVLDDLSLSKIELDTTNGRIAFLDVTSPILIAHTTNGQITGDIESEQCTLTTTNGHIDVTIGEATGEYRFTTTNGGIDINVPENTDIGYYINLDTSIGSIDVDIPNITYRVDQSRTKIGETTDYNTKSIQVRITASTTIGGIDLK